MKRRNFMKIMGFSALSLGIAQPSYNNIISIKANTSYDKEHPIWGSPYYGDTQSTLNYKRASFEQIQRELAHFHMSEKPRDLYLFEVSS